MYNYFSGFIATPTKIRNFLECPRKYWYYHINAETKRLYPEKSYFTLGHHVHNALRDFFTTPAADRSKEQLLQLLEDQWKSKTGTAAGFTTSEIEAESKSHAISMLKLFLATEDWRVTQVYLPEKAGDFPGYKQIQIDNSLAFGGIIDRIDENPDGTLHIIDYKTGKGDEPDEWQLPIYAVLMGRGMNRIVGNISYIFLPMENVTQKKFLYKRTLTLSNELCR